MSTNVKWFTDAKYGMIIHWGLYSIPGRGEWVRSDEQMPEEEYLPFFETFTAKDFAQKTGLRGRYAYSAVHVLEKLGLITKTEHTGRAMAFRV